jgi:hypothetical protein
MTIKEIVIAWLEVYGCNGLCSDDEECGCGIADLMPCNGETGPCPNCVAAIEHIVTDEDEAAGRYENFDVASTIYIKADISEQKPGGKLPGFKDITGLFVEDKKQ